MCILSPVCLPSPRSEHGYLVTIVTELAWKEFVTGKCADVTAGAVRFLPAGGDTALQTSGYIEQTAMSTKTEVMQMIMLAAAEANFFASGFVVAHQIERACREQQIDLLVSGFTMTGVGLMLSERFGIPIVNYCLQPTCIPSSDPGWRSVIPIQKRKLLPCVDRLEARYFTEHGTLQPLKRLFEANPCLPFALPKMRHKLGLEASDTWAAILQQKLPVVIPINPASFNRPVGWHENIRTTDFIFLRERPGGPPAVLADDVHTFCVQSKAQDRKLVVMSFSSMPVARTKMLQCAVKMVSMCETPLSLIYVGKKQPDKVSPKLLAQAHALAVEGRLLEVDKADFGALFQLMDAFIVHGGLGTTVEAMRMKKPVAVTGILLFDQRFWGDVVYQKGIGPPPVHIDRFTSTCVDFVNKVGGPTPLARALEATCMRAACCQRPVHLIRRCQALDPTSSYAKAAAELVMGDEHDDGVHTNVTHFQQLLDSGMLKPAAKASRRVSGK